MAVLDLPTRIHFQKKLGDQVDKIIDNFIYQKVSPIYV